MDSPVSSLWTNGFRCILPISFKFSLFLEKSGKEFWMASFVGNQLLVPVDTASAYNLSLSYKGFYLLAE